MVIKGIRLRKKNAYKKVSKAKRPKNEKSLTKSTIKYIRCFLPGFAFSFLFIALSAYFYLKKGDTGKLIYYLQFLFISIGSFITGYNGFNVFGGRGILTGLFCGIPLGAVYVIILLILVKNNISPFIVSVPAATVIFAAVGGTLSANLTVKR